MKNHILLIFSALLGVSSIAQSDLTLGHAVEKALMNNYQIKIVKANVEVSQMQNTLSNAGMIPTFALNATNAANLSDNTNNPASFFPGKVFSDNLQMSLDMNWTIFNGFGLRINKQRFEQMEVQTKGNAALVIENTIYDVIIAYYTVVVQQQKLEIVNQLLTYSKNKLDYFTLKSDIGVSTSFDLLEFENQVMTDSSNLLLQTLALKNAKRNLNLIMSEGLEANYNLVDDLNFNAPNVTYENLQASMIENNKNIQNQYLNLELQELNIKAQKATYYPVVSLNLGVSPSVGYFQLLGDQGFSSNTNSLNYYGNVSARYTLFNGWNRKRNVQISEIQYEITNIQTEELKMNLSHQLKGVFEMYQVQSNISNLSFKRVNNAETIWKLGQEKYDLGLINVFNLNDIKLAYEQAMLNYFDKSFDVLKSHYDLLRITGNISQEYKV
jgi:outer membrane protein TolC